jgi:hypothetical protein
MTLAAAIAKMRALWPQVTEDAASDTWLTEWYADALEAAGSDFFPETATRLRAVAHLLAHVAYRHDPCGVFGTGTNPGTVSAMTTGRRSVTYGGKSAADFAMSMSDAGYATTRPGQAFLALRDRQLGNVPRVVVP